MVVTGTSSVTTFGTQTFLQTVRVAGAGAAHGEAAGAAQPQAGAGVAQPHAGAAAGAAQPQAEAAGAHPPETGTSSITVWYDPQSLVTVFVVVTGTILQTWRVAVRASV